MSRTLIPRFAGPVLALLALLVVVAPARAQEDSFDRKPSKTDDDGMKKKRPGLFFHHTKKDTPAEQLAYAKKQQDKGHARAACKAYDALVHQWHETPEAAEAQHRYADLLLKRSKNEKAFDQYQYLVRYFAGTFPYQDVLETQFQIANAVRTDRHMDILFLPGYEDPPRAVPLYEKVVENGPNWDLAPEAQFYIGAIQEDDEDYEMAVVSYETLQLRYPASPYVEEAAYRRAHCLYKLSTRNARDEDQCREALTGMLAFQRNYPDNAHVKEAGTCTDELKKRLADLYYDRAIFYDKLAKKPKSAIIAYSDFIGKFPTSERRAAAEERLTVLQLQEATHHEK